MLGRTPDATGCISVDWPSRNVPHGGIFHARKAEPTKETAQFLKILLEESKLAIKLRKKSTWALREQSDGKAGEVYGSQQPCRVPAPRPQTSRRRSLSCIRESGALDADTWRPIQRGEDREVLKQRLQELMEWGNSNVQKQKLTSPAPPPVKTPILPTTKDIKQELLTQIRERAEWLEEMEALGHAAPHRELIRDQIAERLRSLAALGHGECGTARSEGSTVRSTKTSARSCTVQRPDRDVCGDMAKEKTTARTNSSTRTGRSMGRKEHLKRDSRSSSAVPQQRRAAEENVAAYEFTPLGRSPRRRS